MTKQLATTNREYVDSMQRYLPNDTQSRHNWAVATASIMVTNWTLDQLHAVVDGGERRFFRHCRRSLNGHGFHTEDFKNMFAILKRAASMNPNKMRDFISRLVIESST